MWEGELAALFHGFGPVEAALTGDYHPLGDVAQHRVGGAAKRTPGTRTIGSFTLAPYHLAPQQQAEVVLEDVHDIGRQASVRFSAQVGHVNCDPASRLEDSFAFRKNVSQHPEVLEVTARYVATAESLFVLLTREVRRGSNHQGY